MNTEATAAVPLLALEGLGVSFRGAHGDHVAATAVDLSVAAGECLGVVGESGAGKSQLFLAVMGLLGANARVSGSARFCGEQLLGRTPAQLDRVRGAGIAMVFQDPMSSLTPHLCIGDQIAETRVRHLHESWRTARTRAHELLERVHVTDPGQRMRQFPHELSGGMRQRAMIAIALAPGPRLLIADEPTTALDVTIQAQILALLLELKRSSSMGLVLITHDLGAVAGLADRVSVMRAGHIIESGSVQQVLQTPREPYTRALLARSQAPPRAPTSAAAPARAPGLGIEAVSVGFGVPQGLLARPARLRALTDVSLDLATGGSLALVGESGCGKSTLARVALKLLPPDAGRVTWLGQDLAALGEPAMRALRRALQVIFQDPLASLDPRMTVGESIGEGLRVHSPALSAAARQAAAAAALERVGLPAAFVARYPHELSGGQCQRVGIARAMVLAPRLLVCDEPLSALDVPTQQQIVALLRELQRESGMALLFVSHNLAVVEQLCEQALVLYLGRRMELAPVAALFGAPRHPYTRELLAAIPVADPRLQPARLTGVRPGEPPSPLHPPTGCVYRTRCAYAIERCAQEVPAWDEVAPGHCVACHRWRVLPAAAAGAAHT